MIAEVNEDFLAFVEMALTMTEAEYIKEQVHQYRAEQKSQNIRYHLTKWFRRIVRFGRF